MSFSVRPYHTSLKNTWDRVISQSSGDIVLFYRDYMDYHSSRFEDASLLVFDSDEQCVGAFPANKIHQSVYSHQGLTFGGIILSQTYPIQELLKIVQAIKDHYACSNHNELIIKTTPSYYDHSYSEDLQQLFEESWGILKSTQSSSIISLHNPRNYSNRKKRNIKKAQQVNIKAFKTEDFELFWNTILIPNLKQRHNSSPVHSLQEIQMLHHKFPNRIVLYGAFENSEMIAGIVLYKSKLVHHTQYISANERGKEVGALDFLIDQYVLNGKNENTTYLSLGTSSDSTRPGGINEGLLKWKQEFGAFQAPHHTYRLKLINDQ